MDQNRYYRSKMREIATFCSEVQSQKKITEFLLYNRKKYGQGKLSPALKKIFIRKEIIPIAAHMGYYFTVDEFLMYEEKVTEIYYEQALTDDELSEINAGTCVPEIKKTYVLDDIFKDVNLSGYSMSPIVEARNDVLYRENDDLSCTRIKSGEIVYDIDIASMTAKVARCSSRISKNVVIPEVINGKYSVVGIKEGAFCAKNIVSVELPTSVKSIEAYAFENCVYLKYVSGCMNVSYIGESAFEGCKNLEMIDSFGNSTIIPKNAFKDCRSLDYVNISRLISYIDDTAFCNCINIVHLKVSDNNLSYVYRKNIGVISVDDLMHVVIKVDEDSLIKKKAIADRLYKGFEVLKKKFFESNEKPSYMLFLRYMKNCIKNILSSYSFADDSIRKNTFNLPSVLYRTVPLKKSKNECQIDKQNIGFYAFESAGYFKYCCDISDGVEKVRLPLDINIISKSQIDDIKFFIEKNHKMEGYIDRYEALFKKSNSLNKKINILLLNNDVFIAVLLGYNAIYCEGSTIEVDRGDGVCELVSTSFVHVF